jgi:DNA-binding response OmpR family regulator
LPHIIQSPADKVMQVVSKQNPSLTKRQPWGMLPPRMRVLFVTNTSHTGSWLAEAFAADSATQVILEETVGVVHGLARLRDEVFDVVLITHDDEELNALEILDAVRTGASPSQPVIVLGSRPAAEFEAICLESGADAYLTWDTTTTRSLIWQIARASERHQLLEENRQLRQAKLHQRDVDEAESHRMLEIQRRLAEGLAASTAAAAAIYASETSSGWQPPQQLVDHYSELLQTYVIMGAGNLDDELHRLAGVLVTTGIGARQFMRIHLLAVEAMVRDLGKRSARHVMNRADMLAIEVLLCLCEGFREKVFETICPSDHLTPQAA